MKRLLLLAGFCAVAMLPAATTEPPPASLRIGLAGLKLGRDIPDGVAKIKATLAQAASRQVDIVCFSETYLPGLRGGAAPVPPPDPRALEQALRDLQSACRSHRVAAIVGMEWMTPAGLQNRAYVISADGEILGHQTKDQITPGGEERNYVPEGTRRMFAVKGVPFGVAICHEGWRFPETVRWAAVRGAKIVFQPQVTGSDQPGRPVKARVWGQSYYEMAMILRAKENSIYFASVNQAMTHQNSATSLIDPEGNLLQSLPCGEEGLLVADLDLARATGFYASRYRPEFYPRD